MIWLFAGVFFLILGAAVEGYARQSPARRPLSPTANAAWYYLAKASTLLVLAAFIWSFFVVEWWTALAIFVGAFVLNLVFYNRVKRAGAAPGISLALMLMGVPLTILPLLEPSAFSV